MELPVGYLCMCLLLLGGCGIVATAVVEGTLCTEWLARLADVASQQDELMMRTYELCLWDALDECLLDR